MKIAILGGGISGLAAAWTAKKRYPEACLTLYEKTDRLGGWIETTKVGPFLFERGPRTFLRSRSEHLLQLIEEIGLSSKIIVSSAKSTRYVWSRGKLRPISSFWPLILSGVLRDLILPSNGAEEETIASFFSRRFGKKFAEQLVDPFVTGVFGGDSSKLSAQACFPALTQSRSVTLTAMKGSKKAPGLFTLDGGMEQIVEPLSRVLDEVHFNCSLTELPNADLIVSALPAHEIAALLGSSFSVRLEHFSVVSFGFRQDGLLPAGYGYLIPSSEGEMVMGMLWDSAVFPTPGQTKLTVMVRSASPAEEARRVLQEHLKIEAEPEAVLVKSASIPQYDLGHQNRVKLFVNEVKQEVPHLILAGNWLHGASVDQCIDASSGVMESISILSEV